MKHVIVTLGPSLLNHDSRIAAIHALGPCIFRVNGAHTPLDRVVPIVRLVRALAPGCLMMVDLPGDREKKLPRVSRALIKVACELRVHYLSISYVRKASDVWAVRGMVGQPLEGYRGPDIVAKIETAAAVRNLQSIMDTADMINVDRGDLAAAIGVQQVPEAQRSIVAQARHAHKRVYLATHFLKSMERNPQPYISEVMGLHAALESGIDGIQLSEETAIGAYPVVCVALVHSMVKQRERRIQECT